MSQINCVEPRYFSKYHANGTGRDFYVQYTNGGLYKDAKVFYDGVYERTGLDKKTVSSSLPFLQPKFQHYPNDGSGRDFYITCNEGGQLSNNKRFNYLINLRTYNKIPEEPYLNDFLRRSSYTTKRQQIKSRNIRNEQKQLTLKLCPPQSKKCK